MLHSPGQTDMNYKFKNQKVRIMSICLGILAPPLRRSLKKNKPDCNFLNFKKESESDLKGQIVEENKIMVTLMVACFQ